MLTGLGACFYSTPYTLPAERMYRKFGIIYLLRAQRRTLNIPNITGSWELTSRVPEKVSNGACFLISTEDCKVLICSQSCIGLSVAFIRISKQAILYRIFRDSISSSVLKPSGYFRVCALPYYISSLTISSPNTRKLPVRCVKKIVRHSWTSGARY